MPLKILNALLLIAAIFGGVCTFQKSRQHRDLLTEINGLESKVGELAIVDPSKVHVRAIDTGEDLHFAWRIYLPAGFRATWQHRNGGNSMTTRSDPCEFIARLRVYEGDQDGLASHRNGRLHVYYKGSGGSSRATLGDRKLADMLRGRLSEIKVEQLGSDGIVLIDPDKKAVMLRLTLSDELKNEAEKKLHKYYSKRFQKELFSISFGSWKAFAQEASKKP